MLSISAYRSAAEQALANSAIDLGQKNYPYVTGAWPFNFGEENAELASIFNVMHPDRFNYLAAEIGGFSVSELKTFVTALANHFVFQRVMFPGHQPSLPIDDMMAQFVVAKKISSLKPEFQSIFEIGPGSGNLSFFVRGVRMFAQTDVAASFYVLQSLVNSFLFGPAFRELAIESNMLLAREGDAADFLDLDIPARCVHYPWWKIAGLVGQKFDVVTSNANLNEMNSEARRYYLALCRSILAPDGMIISQCLGGNFTGLDWTGARDLLWTDFIQAGFRPVFFVNRGNTKADGEFGRLLDPICLGQVVLVADTHPWWERGFMEPTDFACIDEPLIHQTYFHSREGNQIPSRESLKTAVTDIVLHHTYSGSWPWV